MRRLFRWIAGLVSVAALAKLVAARRRGHDAPPDATGVDGEADPAEELRRKLAEVRAAAPEDAEPRATEPEVDAVAAQAPTATPDAPAGDEEPSPSIEERRAAIHARAQEAIDSMKEIAP